MRKRSKGRFVLKKTSFVFGMPDHHPMDDLEFELQKGPYQMTKGKPFDLNFRAEHEEKFLQSIPNLKKQKGPYQITKGEQLNLYFCAKRKENFLQVKPNLNIHNDKRKTF